MAQSARCEPPPHFEVVDEADQTVGNAKFATSQQAHDLRRALKGTPGMGSLACGSAWKKDPGSGVIGVEKGPLIPVV